MISFRTILLWSIALLSQADSDSQESIAVVELFTSQGCYSCPPADEYLGKLKQQSNIIVLSCHVTYWNYLGWQDTFSRQFCDTRQRHYQQYLQGNAGVYTPQMVVNGSYGIVGSQKNKVNQVIELARSKHPVAPIALSLSSDKHLIIELPEIMTESTQKLLLIGTKGVQTLPIHKGENGGKKLTYHSPVQEIIHLPNWQGNQKFFQHPIKKLHFKEWIVIAQNDPLGKITAAGKLTVH